MRMSSFPGARGATLATALAVGLAFAGCAANAHNIPGTRIADDKINHGIRDAVEAYRIAVERGDAEALFLMASDRYTEDGGTSVGTDDYTYQGLKDVLTGRFRLAHDIRYAMRYVNIQHNCPASGGEPEQGCIARVDVLIDASFTIADARGQDKRVDKRDQNELVLEWNGNKWQFLSGM
ncbi:MAG TPA: hypothetical protein VHE35_25315 [Kofleriaceae bacterium]|nr:hypothetical protein [Kofleriaceae bacterium]